MSQNSTKVLIVGAGLSGFSAAAKLLEKGVDRIILLEAENRIGGRIQSVPQSNGYLDMGGQWCHGQKKNVIYELVNKHFKFGESKFDEADEKFDVSNGQKADEKQCAKLRSLSELIMENSYSEMEIFNGSLGEFFTTNYKKRLQDKKFSDIPVELSSQMLDFFHKETNTFFACPNWFDVSARLDAISDQAEGNQHLTWGTKGFKTVFDFISVSFVQFLSS